MRTFPIVGALALATAALIPAAADAQRWAPGWHEWHGRDVYRRGWDGPGWYGRPGPHYGWYRWNAGWYRQCGWSWSRHGARVWRCY